MSVRFKDGSPEQLFRILERKHSSAIDLLLSKNGISNIGQPVILSILAQEKDGTIASQKELAKRLRVSPATVTVSLKSMERDGYIQKLSNQDDLRCKPISITEKGLEAAERIDRVFESLDHGMYHGFSPEERDQIANLYRRIIGNLECISAHETER